MSRFTGTAPGVDFLEQVEEASRAEGISNAIGIVGVALKGPTEMTLLTNPQDCKAIFGEAPELNSAIKGALACLNVSRDVYFKRVLSKNAVKGVTWEDIILDIEDEALGTMSTTEKEKTFNLAHSNVELDGLTIHVTGSADIVSDGEGKLVQATVEVGTVDTTGKVSISFAAAPTEEKTLTVDYSYHKESPSQKPWAVFSTRDITALYNGYTVRLSWENIGTTDIPQYKVQYQLFDVGGNEVENYRCDEAAEDDLYLGKIINLYSEILYVDLRDDEPVSRATVNYVIAGGNSGLDATVDDIIGTGNSGMKAFYDPESVDIATLVVPTWGDRKVWEEGIAIGKYRKDIVYIPSIPIGLKPKQVLDLVRGAGEFTALGLQFDETFVPVYWPNGTIKDPDTKNMVPVDIAPYIAATYAASDFKSQVWMAPAGVKRGIISGLSGLEYKLTKEERDQLYSTEVNVNPVINIRGKGITIMGVRTSKVYSVTEGNTALRYINIRRLCNYARKLVLAKSMEDLFDPNYYVTWNNWKLRLDPYFREMKEGGGLYDYKIVMDNTTVSQADVDAGRMPGEIWVAPIKPNEYIIIRFVVAKDGTVSFSDPVEQAA